jgi:hypothetical protein
MGTAVLYGVMTNTAPNARAGQVPAGLNVRHLGASGLVPRSARSGMWPILHTTAGRRCLGRSGKAMVLSISTV